MNQVKAGATLNYIIIGLNIVLGLLYTPYMLRMLGQSEYGLYSLVASTIAYLTILDFGFGNAIVRYTAKFRTNSQHTEQYQMFGMFIIIYTFIGLMALCAGLILYYNVEALFDKSMTTIEIEQARVMILLLVVNLAITFPFSIFGSIITAYEDFIFQKIVGILRLLLSTATIIILLYCGYKAVAMVVVQTVFNITTLLLNYFFCKYKLKIKIYFGHFNWSFLKEISIYSFWLFLNAIMDRIYWSTGQFVLGTISGTVAVAVFSIAITLAHMYMTFSTSISSVLLPRVTSMVTKNENKAEISNMFIRTGRLQFIIMAFILSGFIVFGKHFIDIWAGPEYRGAFIITLIFFITLFIPLIQNVGITILQARNQMKFRSLLYVTIAVFSLMFQIILSKLYGALGCAIAIGGALLLGQGLVMNIYYHKCQNLNIKKFWFEIGKMSIVPIVICVIALFILKFYSISSFSHFFIAVSIFTIVFIPLFWKFSMNCHERNLILNPIRSIVTRLNKNGQRR